MFSSLSLLVLAYFGIDVYSIYLWNWRIMFRLLMISVQGLAIARMSSVTLRNIHILNFVIIGWREKILYHKCGVFRRLCMFSRWLLAKKKFWFLMESILIPLLKARIKSAQALMRLHKKITHLLIIIHVVFMYAGNIRNTQNISW